MLFHHRTRKARFAEWSYLALLVLFAVIYTYSPSAGLAGMGAVLVLGSLLVEANKELIWESYKKGYKAKNSSLWSKPDPLYYKLNVYLVWPLVFVVGLLAIAASVVA